MRTVSLEYPAEGRWKSVSETWSRSPWRASQRASPSITAPSSLVLVAGMRSGISSSDPRPGSRAPSAAPAAAHNRTATPITACRRPSELGGPSLPGRTGRSVGAGRPRGGKGPGDEVGLHVVPDTGAVVVGHVALALPGEEPPAGQLLGQSHRPRVGGDRVAGGAHHQDGRRPRVRRRGRDPGRSRRPDGAPEEVPGQQRAEDRSRPGEPFGQGRVARRIAADRVVEAVDGLLGIGGVGGASGPVAAGDGRRRCTLAGGRGGQGRGQCRPRRAGLEPAQQGVVEVAGPGRGAGGRGQGPGLTGSDQVEQGGRRVAGRMPRAAVARGAPGEEGQTARTPGCRPGRCRRPPCSGPGRWPRRAPWPGRGWGRARHRWPRGASRRSGR